MEIEGISTPGTSDIIRSVFEMSTPFDVDHHISTTDLDIFGQSVTQEVTSTEPFATDGENGPTISEVLTGQEALTATTVVYTVMGIISVFGIFINIVNIIVFVRLGLNKETINVGFCALSLADLLTLVTLFLMGLVNSPVYPYLSIPMVPYDATLLLTGPFMSASATSHCVTALISVERCFCVVLPLKVKRIFTIGRVRAAVLIIWAVNMLGAIPKYATTNIAWRPQSDEKNTTMLEFVYTPLMRQVEELTIQIMNVLIPFVIYLLVVICTVILVVQLRQALKRRRELMTDSTVTVPPFQTSTSVRSDPGCSSSSLETGCAERNLHGNGSGKVKRGAGEISEEPNANIVDAPESQSGASTGDAQPNMDIESGYASSNGGFNETNVQTIEAKEAMPRPSPNRDKNPKPTPKAGAIPRPSDPTARLPQAPRSTLTPFSSKPQTSKRELSVLKFVVAICIIFLTCTSPTVVLIAIYLIWPRFHGDTPEFQNLMHLLISFPFLTQAVSSSVNIVFYFRMSSRYRPVFLALFKSCTRSNLPSSGGS